MSRSFPSSRTLRRVGAIWCAATLSGPALAQVAAPDPAAAQDLKEPDVFQALQVRIQHELEKCRGAIVRIEGSDEHSQLAGTGFFVDPNGMLYTSYTVGGETKDLVVCRGDLKFPARRLVADRGAGIALLQVETETAFLPIGSSRELTPGAPLMTFGFPLDLPLTPSFGMLGGFDRKYLGRYFTTTHLRANVSVQRGEGGAPLLNFKGEVVGILISSLDGGSASFALPIEAAEKVRRDYLRYGHLRPGWLGLQMDVASTPVLGSTALVQEVFPGAPAQKAGLREGDLLLQIGQHPITCREDLIEATYFLTADDPVPVRVARHGAELTLQVQPGDPPQPQAKTALPVAIGDEKLSTGLNLDKK